MNSASLLFSSNVLYDANTQVLTLTPSSGGNHQFGKAAWDIDPSKSWNLITSHMIETLSPSASNGYLDIRFGNFEDALGFTIYHDNIGGILNVFHNSNLLCNCDLPNFEYNKLQQLEVINKDSSLAIMYEGAWVAAIDLDLSCNLAFSTGWLEYTACNYVGTTHTVVDVIYEPYHVVNDITFFNKSVYCDDYQGITMDMLEDCWWSNINPETTSNMMTEGYVGIGTSPQYPLDVKGDVRVSGAVTGTTFISTVATGTAPLFLSSTTAVTNLNADLLDGQHGSYYLNYANLTGAPTIPAAQIQSDWNQTNSNQVDFIKNKPTVPIATWSTSGCNIYYTNGNVGVGTDRPVAALHSYGDSLFVTEKKELRSQISSLDDFQNTRGYCYGAYSPSLNKIVLVGLTGNVCLHVTPTVSNLNYQADTTSLENVSLQGGTQPYISGWTRTEYPITGVASTTAFQSIIWSAQHSQFVAILQTRPVRILTSPDGITWTINTQTWSTASTGFNPDLGINAAKMMLYSPTKNLYVCVGAHDGTTPYKNVITSTDGKTWTQRGTSANTTLFSVCESSFGYFVAVGGNATGVSSSDGITWYNETLTQIATWGSICYSPKLSLYCAVNYTSSTARVATWDGTTWTNRTSDITIGWRCVTWDDQSEQFVAIGAPSPNNATNKNRMMTSPDGINWTVRAIDSYYALGAYANWRDIIQIPNPRTYYIVGHGDSYTNNISYENFLHVHTTRVPLYWQKGRLGIGKLLPLYPLDMISSDARKLTGTTWLTGSDRRLKDDIEEADYLRCYDIVKKLPLKRFAWSSNIAAYNQVSDRHQLGWIAQEVQEHIPKAVRTCSDHGIPDLLNLDADQIYACTFGALKAAISRIEELERRLEAQG